MKKISLFLTLSLFLSLLTPCSMAATKKTPVEKPFVQIDGWKIYYSLHDTYIDLYYEGTATEVTVPPLTEVPLAHEDTGEPVSYEEYKGAYYVSLCSVSDSVKSLTITDDVNAVGTDLSVKPIYSAFGKNLENITVVPENKNYFSHEGVLYSKRDEYLYTSPSTGETRNIVRAIQQIIFYPPQKKDKEYTVADGTEEVNITNNYLQKINVPKSVKKLDFTSSTITKFEIPPTLKSCYITAPKLTSIKIPNSVTFFSLASNSISSLNIPNSVTSFNLTSNSIPSLNIPNSVTFFVLTSNSISSLKIPSSVTTFSLTSDSISSLNIPSSVTFFTLTSNSISSIKIPSKSKLKEIRLSAKKIKSINLPKTIKYYYRINENLDSITLSKKTATLKLKPKSKKTITLKSTIKTYTSIKIGDKKLTQAQLLKRKTIAYSSSNKKIAKVSKTGKITALKTGKVKITAKLGNGKKVICTVTVKKK